MKKIFIQMTSPVFRDNKLFSGTDVNNSTDRWKELKRKLLERGYDLMTADENSLDDCEGIIFHDATSLDESIYSKKTLSSYLMRLRGKKVADPYPVRKLYDEAVAAGKRNKLLLLIWEGKAVTPANFSTKILNMFDRVLTWDDTLTGQKFTHYMMPMENPTVIHEAIPFAQKKLLVNISFNKYSPYTHELYTARRDTIGYFDEHYPNNFDLFGVRWNEPVTFLQRLFPKLVKHYGTYRGHTKDKLKTLSEYKFSVCYENNSDAHGYISEKIFDCLKARIVPIYYGAPNVDQYVDADTYIDRRSFKSEAELAEFLTSMTESQYQTYLNAAERYMKSEKYKKFFPEAFCDQIIKALGI